MVKLTKHINCYNIVILIVTSFIILNQTGCFFGTFQTAKTRGKGNGGIYNVYINYALDNSEENLEITDGKSGMDVGWRYTGPITDRLDLGINWAGVTLTEFFAKYMFYYNNDTEFASSALFGLRPVRGYNTKGEKIEAILPRLSFMCSKDISNTRSLYGGASIHSAPYKKGDVIDTVGELCLGIKWTREEKPPPGYGEHVLFSSIPLSAFKNTGFMFEIIFPINNPYGIIALGTAWEW